MEEPSRSCGRTRVDEATSTELREPYSADSTTCSSSGGEKIRSIASAIPPLTRMKAPTPITRSATASEAIPSTRPPQERFSRPLFCDHPHLSRYQRRDPPDCRSSCKIASRIPAEHRISYKNVSCDFPPSNPLIPEIKIELVSHVGSDK